MNKFTRSHVKNINSIRGKNADRVDTIGTIILYLLIVSVVLIFIDSFFWEKFHPVLFLLEIYFIPYYATGIIEVFQVNVNKYIDFIVKFLDDNR